MYANHLLSQIDLFVKSKAIEIDRRIGNSVQDYKRAMANRLTFIIVQCQRAITTLYEKDKSNTLSAKRLARYVKAEAEVERYDCYETHLSNCMFANCA